MAKKNADVSGWIGWIGFASIMLLLVGFFHAITGFVALFQEDIFLVGENNVWLFDSSAWGWIHILWGCLALLAGVSLAKGGMYGRIIAVIVALTSAIANMAFVPVYPVWSILIVTIDVLILWAVVVHGGEMKEIE